MSSLKFSVIGIGPAPQGSKSFVGKNSFGKAILVESSQRVKPWRQAVSSKALEMYKSTLTRCLQG